MRPPSGRAEPVADLDLDDAVDPDTRSQDVGFSGIYVVSGR
jgi:hypothetical protein